MEILDRVADCLRGPLQGSTLTVIAYTDARGTGSYNQNLGNLRSRAVRDYLTARGVPASRIALISHEEPTQTEQGRATAATGRNLELDVAQAAPPRAISERD